MPPRGQNDGRNSRDTREPPVGARPPRQRLNEFFVDGARIHREVMQREICKFLGPEAYSKPHSYNGIQGYLVSAIRPFTPDQLDDLQELSEAYESENRQMKKRGYPGIPYENSEVSRRQDATLRHSDSADMMMDDYYPSQPQPQYTTASTQQGYPALTSSYAQPSGGLYTGSAYSTDPNYPVGSSYTTPYPSGSARPNDNYSYGNESPRNDPYRQPPGYAATQRLNPGRTPDSRDPRQDPRMEARYAPGRDARMDPRDPRAMQQQPQGYGYTSAADSGAGYAYAAPAPLPGRGMEPYPPPRAPVYDHPYRNEPVRDARPDMRDDGRRRR
ncbi:hypothetical protein JMJ35_004274 [Cladonia borealis]|uniref:Transcription factor RfeG n=1 Tax=Cladonia borealis TaxID=184061 RepID=A0AA39R1S5_9LECA|nr:hypothetical protein JMJ35_004274 [Cladonia borealis]